MDQSPDLFVMPAMQCSQENMLRRIFCIDYRQKLLVHLNMEIGENIKFGVGLYNFTRLVNKLYYTEIQLRNSGGVQTQRTIKTNLNDL